MKLLIHNVVQHPIAGILWFFKLYRAGDWVHDLGIPKHLRKQH